MRKILFLFLGLILFNVTGSAVTSFPTELLEGKSYYERYFYLDLIYSTFIPSEDSIRFFSRVNELRALAEKKDDIELKRETELLTLCFNLYHHSNNQTLCNRLISNMVSSGRKERDPVFLARIYGIAAEYYWDKEKSYALALQYYHEEYDIIHHLSVEKYPAKQKAIYMLGDRYYDFNRYDVALVYLVEAMNTDAYGASLYYTLQATNTAGLCYQQMGKLDSADYFFSRANAVAITVGNEAWDGITSGNMGYNHFIRGNYAEAKKLLQKDLDLSIERHDWGCASGSLITLAEMNIMDGKTDMAMTQLKQAYDWILESNEKPRFKNLYPVLSKLYLERGNEVAAALYLDSVKTLETEIQQKREAREELFAKQKAELADKEVASAKSEKLVNIAVFAAIGGIPVLLLLTFFQYLGGKRRAFNLQV